MDATSPVKRRVLGEIHPNMPSPKSSQLHTGTKAMGVENVQQRVFPASKLQVSAAQEHLRPRADLGPQSPPNSSPVKENTKKRALPTNQAEEESPRKKTRPSEKDVPERQVDSAVDNDEGRCAATDNDDSQQRPLSPLSPAASTIFDNSEADTSQATAITEPDAPAAVRVQPRAPIPERPGPSLNTSELNAIKQKLSYLRGQIDSRLKLASYKVETNQVSVPFEQLRRPSPPPRRPLYDGRFSAGLAPGDKAGRVSGAPPDVLRAVVRAMEERARAALNRTKGLAPSSSAIRVVEERRGMIEEDDDETAEAEKTDSSESDGLPRLPSTRPEQRPQQRTPLPNRPTTPKRNRPENEIHLSSSARGAASLLSLRRS
ncbi:hypothetical protein OQA88_7594 [Cercophora sp. LCS_1]